MQNYRANNLHRECALAQNSGSCLAADGKCFGHDVVEGLAGSKLGFKAVGLCAQLRIGVLLIFVLKRQNLIFYRLNALKLSFTVGAENLIKKSHDF